MSGLAELEGEDAKLVILARAARGRAYPLSLPAEGAAVRDSDGRTYTAATVAHTDPALVTSALRGAVSAAVSSGARSFEAAVVVGDRREVTADDVAVLAEFGSGVPVYAVSAVGEVVGETST